MQLMPATASYIANKMQLPFSADRLTADGIYNVLLGRAYLEALIEDFGGSYALAIAGYNAGPSRVRQWLRDYGDPRGGNIDMVDWIEMHPDQRNAKLRSAGARKPADLSRSDRPRFGIFACQRLGSLKPLSPGEAAAPRMRQLSFPH